MFRNTSARIAALAVAGLTAASLAACDPAENSSSSSTNSVVTVTKEASPAAEPAGSGEFLDEYTSSPSRPNEERAFLTTLNNEGIYGNDDELVGAGREACELFSSGLDGYDMILRLMSGTVDLLPQTDEEDEAFIVGAATGTFCPQHGHLVDELG